MAFYYFRTRKLAADISKDKLSERDTYKYFIANTLLWTISLYYGSMFGGNISWVVIFEVIVVIIITVIGLIKSYEINGGDNGVNFLIRATCLSFPIGLKVTIVSAILGWAVYFLFPIVINPVVFRDPDRAADLLAFFWGPTFTAIFFWRLWTGFNLIKIMNQPA